MICVHESTRGNHRPSSTEWYPVCFIQRNFIIDSPIAPGGGGRGGERCRPRWPHSVHLCAASGKFCCRRSRGVDMESAELCSAAYVRRITVYVMKYLLTRRARRRRAATSALTSCVYRRVMRYGKVLNLGASCSR